MAWSFGLRLHLYGDCRLDGGPGEPVELELSLRRAVRRVFTAQGVLRCPALGPERAIQGDWTSQALALDLGGGWSFTGHPDPTVPPSLLRRSLWTGPLTHAAEPRGVLRLRFDLRHDWPALVRSLRL